MTENKKGDRTFWILLIIIMLMYIVTLKGVIPLKKIISFSSLALYPILLICI